MAWCGDVWIGRSSLEHQVSKHWAKNPDRYENYSQACNGYFYYLHRLKASDEALFSLLARLDGQSRIDQW